MCNDSNMIEVGFSFSEVVNGQDHVHIPRGGLEISQLPSQDFIVYNLGKNRA